jgi:mannose-1-phosphate guanylyltransferase
MRPLHAMVLTAGLGTRLRPLTLVRAKPAIPVAGQPMIRRIARWLAANGVTDIVLNLHHLPQTVTAVMGDGSDLGVRVRYSWEQPVVLGSAGGPRLALPIIGTETFLLVNGDTLTDLDLTALVRVHEEADALVTMAVVTNVEPHRYGGLQIDSEGRVTGFVPRGSSAEGTYHFIGVQVVRAEAFRTLASGEISRTVGGLYDEIVRRSPGSIRVSVSRARFWDIGTLSDYWHTSQAFEQSEGTPDVSGERVFVDPAATVTRSILWDDVHVGPGCHLDACILADGVQVVAGSSYERSVIIQANGHPMVTPIG